METVNGTSTTHTYQYGNSQWRDLLTAYDGDAITYDAGGNPLTYRDGITFTWKNGRQLASYEDSTYRITYDYNVSGIRVKKTVTEKSTGTVTVTENYLEGTVVIAQKITTTPSNGNASIEEIWYSYDGTGNVVGMQTNAGTYYFKKNLQGDIVAILNNTGEEVVSYHYDAWGNIISVNDTSNAQFAEKNPFTYRGYYRDHETGFYYLQSRYYDSVTERFINSDNVSIVESELGICGTNLFTYCVNNPVVYMDPFGESVVLACVLIGAGVGLIIGTYVGNRVANKKQLTPKDGWNYWKYVVGYGVVGTVTGGLVGYGAGALVSKYGISAAAASITKGGGARFASYAALKRSMGSAGKGMHWHHIVEQSQIKKSGFSKYWIHNSNNVIKIDALTHQKITAYYNKKHSFTNGKTFRDWLAGKSFKEQYKWGIDILKKYGVKVR